MGIKPRHGVQYDMLQSDHLNHYATHAVILFTVDIKVITTTRPAK